MIFVTVRTLVAGLNGSPYGIGLKETRHGLKGLIRSIQRFFQKQKQGHAAPSLAALGNCTI